jgi:hypothetical protein
MTNNEITLDREALAEIWGKAKSEMRKDCENNRMSEYYDNQKLSQQDREKHVEMVKKSFPKSTESGLDKVKEER